MCSGLLLVSAASLCTLPPDEPCGAAAPENEQSPRGHTVLLDHLGPLHDHGRDGRRLPRRHRRPQPYQNRAGDERHAGGGAGMTVPAPGVRGRCLLGVGRTDQHRRHPHHRCVDRRPRRAAGGHHRGLHRPPRATFAPWYAAERTPSIPTPSSPPAAKTSTGRPSCSPSRSAPPRATWSPNGRTGATRCRWRCSARIEHGHRAVGDASGTELLSATSVVITTKVRRTSQPTANPGTFASARALNGDPLAPTIRLEVVTNGEDLPDVLDSVDGG